MSLEEQRVGSQGTSTTSSQQPSSSEQEFEDITHVGFVGRDGIEDQSRIFTSEAAPSEESFRLSQASSSALRRGEEEEEKFQPFLSGESQQFPSEVPEPFEEQPEFEPEEEEEKEQAFNIAELATELGNRGVVEFNTPEFNKSILNDLYITFVDRTGAAPFRC